MNSNAPGAPPGYGVHPDPEYLYSKGIAQAEAEEYEKELASSRGRPESRENRATSSGSTSSPTRKRRARKAAPDATFVTVATPHNDDPWSENLDDGLGVTDEAKAFARLAIAKEFTPPLAIGVFGNWGTGKSFFMRLVHTHIEQLSKGDPSTKAPEANPDVFHKEVVQIRFNAWHYAETNLWASLIDHMFTELDAWLRARNGSDKPNELLENLSTARTLTLESVEQLVMRRREQRDATDRLSKAESALKEKQEEAGISAGAYWAAFRAALDDANTDPKIADAAKKFKEATKELGIGEITESTIQLRSVSAALLNEQRRMSLLSGGLLKQLQKKRYLLLFSAIVFLAVPVATLASHLLGLLPPYFESLKKGFTALNIGIVAGTALAARVLTVVRSALTKLEKAKTAMDLAIKEQSTETANDVAEKADALVKITAEVEEAKALVTEASNRLARATLEHAGSSGADRLIKFIRSRAADGHYAKHLGLIAGIRKDFEELSSNILPGRSMEKDLLDKQRETFKKRVFSVIDMNRDFLTKEEIAKLSQADQTQGPKDIGFERIVLYIDDLDRCPPDKVVDVLQAVHLLLTFPIFVVMVAVDVRWVQRALEKQYSTLLDASGGKNSDTASPLDYLEKIFQIPYWVRPMDPASSSAFMEARLSRSAGKDRPDTIYAPTPDHPQIVGANVATLEVTAEEAEYLQKMAPFAGGSPRRAVRFVNVYRLIKAGLAGRPLNELVAGEYKALIAQLAIATSAPKILDDWIELLGSLPLDANIEKVRDTIPSLRWPDQAVLLINEILMVYEEESSDSGTSEKQLGALKKYVQTARRYSFSE